MSNINSKNIITSKLISKQRSISSQPILLSQTEAAPKTTSGTPVLFKSLVEYLLYGKNVFNEVIPKYLNILKSDGKSILSYKLQLNGRISVEDTYYAVFNAIVPNSALLENPGSGEITTILKLYSSDDSNAPALMSVDYLFPRDSINSNQSLLLEWKIGFQNVDNSSTSQEEAN